jgi:hypothetical protein
MAQDSMAKQDSNVGVMRDGFSLPGEHRLVECPCESNLDFSWRNSYGYLAAVTR